MTAFRRPLVLLAAASLLAAWAPSPARGQSCVGGCRPLRLGAEATTIATNSLLGGLTAGALRKARGGSFREGFVRGLGGGALTYVGKRVAAERIGGAGLVGRQVAAVGGSITRNAADGVPVLDRMLLPLGPLHLYVHSAGGTRVTARVDVANVLATAFVAQQDGAKIDWSESLSAGAPVFQRTVYRSEVEWEAMQVAGVVVLRRDPATCGIGQANVAPCAVRQQVPVPAGHVAHERVHVLQYDQAFLLWGAPAEDRLLGRERRGLGRWLDLGLAVPLWTAANLAVPYRARPWESEASFLSGTEPEDPPLSGQGAGAP